MSDKCENCARLEARLLAQMELFMAECDGLQLLLERQMTLFRRNVRDDNSDLLNEELAVETRRKLTWTLRLVRERLKSTVKLFEATNPDISCIAMTIRDTLKILDGVAL